MPYSEQQITDYLDLAQEVGITRAKRELGYPKSWQTGQTWANQRGLKLPTDEVMAKAAAIREWYKEEDKLMVCQEGIDRIHNILQDSQILTPEEIRKLADANKKFIETMNLIQGKATAINKDEAKVQDDAFLDALKAFESSTTVKEDTAANS